MPTVHDECREATNDVTSDFFSFCRLSCAAGPVTWINILLPSSLPSPCRPSALLPGIMATWAYPPLPADQLTREADSALVRKETLTDPGVLSIPEWIASVALCQHPIFRPVNLSGFSNRCRSH